MATRLKDTDVVVVGLGAAGGVAVLPLAQAGIDVVGLEAGTWLTQDATSRRTRLRNNVRDWPMAVQKAQQEVPTHRVNAKRQHDARRQPPDDERRRRHDAALLGAELAAQSVGLQGRQRDDASATARRACRRDRPSKTGRSASTSSSRTTTRSNTKSASRDRPATSRARSIRAATSSKGPRNRAYPMPPLRSTGFIDLMTSAARGARLASVSRARRRSTRARYQGRSACMYHGFCNKGGCHVDAKNGPHLTTIPRAQETGRLKVVTRAHVDVDRHRRQRPRHRRDLRDRRPGVHPAREGRAARRATPTRTRGCCCCRSRRRFRTACRTITARSGATT